MKRIVAAVCIIFGAVAAQDLVAQQATLKIGIVDTETIVKQMPEAAEAEVRLGDVMKRYRDTLDSIQMNFQSKFEAYKKQEAMLTADGKRQKEDELRALQQQFVSYQEQKFGNMGEVAQMREQLLAPMRKKVQDAIAAVAKEEKMNFVFDKINAALLYSDDKADITYRVLDKLKRGSK